MHRAHFGDWTPGRTNNLLLLVQVGFAVQSAARGMDYVLPSPPGPTPRVLTVVEASAPLWLWGSGFLLGAGLIVIGLSGGWRWLIVSGHGMLGALYTGFGYGMLLAAPVSSWPTALVGALLLVPGFWLVLTRWPRRNAVRFAASMVTVGVGGWTCALGLGYDFRTATGLLIAGTVHAGFAIGMAWVKAGRTPRPMAA